MSQISELKAALERAEHRLKLARDKYAHFEKDTSNQRDLFWLADEVSKAETDVVWARHRLAADK